MKPLKLLRYRVTWQHKSLTARLKAKETLHWTLDFIFNNSADYFVVAEREYIRSEFHKFTLI